MSYYLLGSYANIYLKEGIMQNKVLKVNINLRIYLSLLFPIFMKI